jgi:hypothetical protein
MVLLWAIVFAVFPSGKVLTCWRINFCWNFLLNLYWTFTKTPERFLFFSTVHYKSPWTFCKYTLKLHLLTNGNQEVGWRKLPTNRKQEFSQRKISHFLLLYKNLWENSNQSYFSNIFHLRLGETGNKKSHQRTILKTQTKKRFLFRHKTINFFIIFEFYPVLLSQLLFWAWIGKLHNKSAAGSDT